MGAAETTKSLEDYLMAMTQTRFQKYCEGATVMQIEQLSSPVIPQGKYGFMSVILLWGFYATILLKTHFTDDLARRLAAQKLRKTPEEIDLRMAQDFMREFSNMQGGYFRSIADINKAFIGMSLPFIANGQDEEIFAKIRDPKIKVSTWRLFDGESEITCSAEIVIRDYPKVEALQGALFADLAQSQSDSSSDGDVEFL